MIQVLEENSMLVRKNVLTVFTAIAAFGFALSASAYNLPMTGSWYSNRGPLIDIPINGGPALCGPNNPMTGCMNNFRPAAGGVPGAGSVNVPTPGSTPNDPASFTIPTNVFGQVQSSQTAVSIVPTVIQLDTHFQIDAPLAASKGTHPDRVFKKSDWVGQSGRVAQHFAWCPGVGGGQVGQASECLDPRPSINGNATPASGLIRYTGGITGGFGGTMGLLIQSVTPGHVWVFGGATGGGMALLIKLGLGGGPVTAQVNGDGYGVTRTIMLNTGPIYLGFMTSNQTPLQTGIVGPMNGLITSIGFTLPTPAPADQNRDTGFPWTTAHLFVQDLEAGGAETFSQAGSDTRTQAGAGNITLVSGGTSFRVGAVRNTKHFDIVTMTLPEPGAALMLGLSLGVIGGLYGLRRKF